MRRFVTTILLLVLLAAASPAHAHTRMMTFENWLFWWAYNRDEFLVRKEPAEHRLTNEDIHEKIVPALEAVIANDDIHPDIRGTALVALARCRPADLDPGLFVKIAAPDSGEDQLTRESAILALAVAPGRGPKVRECLLSIVPSPIEKARVRGFAMMALGLLRDDSDEVFDALAARLDGTETEVGPPVCALFSIGLIGDRRRVPTLLGWLAEGRVGDHDLTDLERASLVSALAKIGDVRATEAVATLLPDAPRHTKRAALLAMGQLVPVLPPERQLRFVQLITTIHGQEENLTERSFIALALGRIAHTGSTSPAAKRATKTFLVKLFREGHPTRDRPWVAIALGLLGRANPRDRAELSGLVRRELARMEGDKLALGALAVSLGMMQDRESVALLKGILARPASKPKLRASAALALGMIGDESARSTIVKALDFGQDRDLDQDLATAAGLLRDPRAAGPLIEQLRNPKSSQFRIGSAALALGRLRDRRGVEPLLAILETGKTEGTYPDLTRALVVVALGQMADRRRIPVLARLRRNVNYRANVPAIDEILCIL